MSFYRTYRPQVIGEIDNAVVRETFLKLLKKPKENLPHAFLFSGPRGSGKTTAARIVAKLFNCLKLSKDTGPCGLCEQCVSVAKGTNLDILEIDAASNRGIDEIRAIRDSINLAPSSASVKVYIIDEVHMLTTEAFNALLKTLEEPPAHAVFVLATTDQQKVPVTIISRCIHLTFAKASETELLHALERIIKKESIDIDPSGLKAIVANVDGSFRDAVKYLEQISFHKGHITSGIVSKILALSDDVTRQKFLLHLKNHETEQALGIIEGLTQDGSDIKTFLVNVLRDLASLLVAETIGGKQKAWDMEFLKRTIRALSTAYVEMKGSAIPTLPLELAVIELTLRKQELKPVPIVPIEKITPEPAHPSPVKSGLNTACTLSFEQLQEHWQDVIYELKSYNHSIAGVMRSTRPKSVTGNLVSIEAFYTFHKDKLSESKTRDAIAIVLKKLFGENVTIDVVLGKK
jgi:DNA polymerase-3 subunit gamma/tau